MRREGLVAVVLLAVLCIRPVTSQELPFHRVAMHYQSIEDLEGTGFDAVYLVVWWGGLTWDQGKPSIEEVLRLRSVELSTRGVKTAVGLFYCMPSNPDMVNYSRAVGKDRLPEAVVPSPLDETWWNYYVDRPAVLIANLSLQYPIWGIVWDWERYVDRNFETWDYSYDEAAIQEFACQTNRTIPYIPPVERYSWLESHGLLEEFHRWQEQKLFRMAKETESMIHAINPNLSLGLLAFSDDWFPWNVLTAFNSSGAPVTAWVATYSGYNTFRPTPAEIRYWLKEEHKLNAFFLPGIWAPYGPWRTLTEMEAATRDSAAFWVFLWDRGDTGHPFEDYKRLYGIFNSFIFFNTSSPHPLPSFDLYPGVQAKPYLGPNGTVSVLLDPYSDIVPKHFTIFCDSQPSYAGKNLTTKLLDPNPILGPSDIPCIISGLTEEDLMITETWAMIQELQDMTRFYTKITEMPLDTDALLARALEDFNAGRFIEARSFLLGSRESIYRAALEGVLPTVQEYLASPRTSKVPLPIVRSVSVGAGFFLDGRTRQAEAYLFDGLRRWAAVSEPITWFLLAGIAFLWDHLSEQPANPGTQNRNPRLLSAYLVAAPHERAPHLR